MFYITGLKKRTKMSYSDKPCLIDFGKIGELNIGYLSVAEGHAKIPFDIKRIFWSYYTPESVVRGRHAHHKTEMVLIAVSGWLILTTIMPGNEVQTFRLDKPNVGVYMPPYCWHTMQYSHSAVQLVICSEVYKPEDYIRDWEEFKQLPKSKI